MAIEQGLLEKIPGKSLLLHVVRVAPSVCYIGTGGLGRPSLKLWTLTSQQLIFIITIIASIACYH